MRIADFFYSITCLSFTIILGAGIYEHIAVWPNAYAAPPASLSMFQGEYGLDAGAFWIVIHPLTLLLFIATLIISWKTERRKNVLIAFAGYFLILIITNLYFVPELMEITGTQFSSTVDENLVARGRLWSNLSIVRAIILSVLALILFLGLTKPLATRTIPDK